MSEHSDYTLLLSLQEASVAPAVSIGPAGPHQQLLQRNAPSSSSSGAVAAQPGSGTAAAAALNAHVCTAGLATAPMQEVCVAPAVTVVLAGRNGHCFNPIPPAAATITSPQLRLATNTPSLRTDKPNPKPCQQHTMP
jgi:hypothetical protein